MLDSFDIKYTSQQRHLKKFANIIFESIYLQEVTFKYTDTTREIWKHIQISVSTPSKVVEEPCFFLYTDPHHIVASCIGALERLASQSMEQMKILIMDI